MDADKDTVMNRPNFIIAGERRSGTTTLVRYLENHPDIYLHPVIDMAYFIEPELRLRANTVRGHLDEEASSRQHDVEAYAARFSEAGSCTAVGEKSADYLFWTPAHARIQRACPDIRWVVILRHPVERAWSHYWNEVGKGRESLPFEAALEGEAERSRADDFDRFHRSYQERGCYDRSLRTLYETFPREQVHVMILDDLINSPIPTLQSLYRFLGVDSEQGWEKAGAQYNQNWTTFPREGVQRNALLRNVEQAGVRLHRAVLRRLIPDTYRRSRIQLKIESTFRRTVADLHMNPETRKQLLERFKPNVIATGDLIGKDLSAWQR